MRGKCNNCPYRSKNGNLCVHRKKKVNGFKKTFCPYSNAHKCKLYNEWVIEKRLIEEGLK